MGKIGIIFWEG